MTLGAADLLVHPAQWIACRVVVELGIGPDRFPTGVRVAVLAGCGDGAVRIGHFRLRTADAGTRIARRLLRGSSRKQWHESNHDRSEPARTSHRTLRELQGPANGCKFKLRSIAYAPSKAN